jgi:antitoxin component YwqK of YwqJK toxin-antitoxin module
MTLMTKIAFFLICFISVSLSVFSQDRKYDYFADADFNIVKEKKAAFGATGTIESGLYRLDFYNLGKGYLRRMVHYKNEKLEQKEGTSLRYYPNGQIEWRGEYKNDQFDKLWLQKDSTGRTTDSVIYDEGKLKFEHVNYYYPNGKLNGYRITDSVNNTLEEKMYTEEGKLRSEANFIGDIGTAKDYDSLNNVTTTLLSTRSATEATFPGGAKEFKKYLERNLNGNTPVENGAPAGTYTVIVRFIVAKDGTISNIVPETNRGYGMEHEVIKMIRQSPPWDPAVQFGRKINAYRRQPVTFIVAEEKSRRRN